MTRDPRIDPQPGDEVRVGPYMRRVLKREGARLRIATDLAQYWMRVDTWQKWCGLSGAEAVTVAKQPLGKVAGTKAVAASAKVRSAKAPAKKKGKQ
jgi:hypothetical protein